MIKAVLFDLGGVLVHFAGVGPLLNLSGGTLSEKSAWDFWWNSEVVRAFEKGKITPETFALGVISQLNLNITADAFLEDFARWEQGPYPGALQLLEKLKKNIPLHV
jgi:FMN phosphatase YigB (HAD superfamily)